MGIYLNELAPWERKSEYLHHIQLGKDLKSQTTILRDALNNQTRAQLASASAIIASQDRIVAGIGELSCGLNQIEQGIEGLQDTFVWGISEIVWQIEQNREVLKGILEVLMTPLDTQAKERRKRAENAYSNGWFDDAEEEFLESEKLNRYDFTIHISLGLIYLFHKTDKEKALEYFENAIKYAKPESNYYTSYALLYKALLKRDFGLIEEAENHSSEAIALSPNFIEAIYQNAQYNALLNKYNIAIPSLRKCINSNIKYCLKIDKEKDFDGIRTYINELFISVKDSENEKATKKLQSLCATQALHSKMNGEVQRITPYDNLSSLTDDISATDEISKAEAMIANNTIFDAREANIIIDNFEEKIKLLQKKYNIKLRSLIDSYSSESKSLEYSIEANKQAKKLFLKSLPKAIGISLIATVFFGIVIGTIVGTIIGLITNAAIGLIVGLFIALGLGYKIIDDETYALRSNIKELPHDVNKKIKERKTKADKLLSIQSAYNELS